MQVNVILTVVALCLRLFLSLEAERGPLERYFVLVQFDISGRYGIYYIAEAVCFKDGDNCEIIFLRRSNKMDNTFVNFMNSFFSPLRGPEIFLGSTASGPTLGSIQPPVQWALGGFPCE
jgi:hypothetical protein